MLTRIRKAGALAARDDAQHLWSAQARLRFHLD